MFVQKENKIEKFNGKTVWRVSMWKFPVSWLQLFPRSTLSCRDVWGNTGDVMCERNLSSGIDSAASRLVNLSERRVCDIFLKKWCAKLQHKVLSTFFKRQHVCLNSSLPLNTDLLSMESNRQIVNCKPVFYRNIKSCLPQKIIRRSE